MRAVVPQQLAAHRGLGDLRLVAPFEPLRDLLEAEGDKHADADDGDVDDRIAQPTRRMRDMDVGKRHYGSLTKDAALPSATALELHLRADGRGALLLARVLLGLARFFVRAFLTLRHRLCLPSNAASRWS